MTRYFILDAFKGKWIFKTRNWRILYLKITCTCYLKVNSWNNILNDWWIMEKEYWSTKVGKCRLCTTVNTVQSFRDFLSITKYAGIVTTLDILSSRETGYRKINFLRKFEYAFARRICYNVTSYWKMPVCRGCLITLKYNLYIQGESLKTAKN